MKEMGNEVKAGILFKFQRLDLCFWRINWAFEQILGMSFAMEV